MKPMNIKKLASLLFQRSVIVAALILVQAALIIGMLALSSAGYSYVRWGSLVLSVLAVLIIVSRQTDPGYKIAWIVPILLFPAFGWLLYLLCGVTLPLLIGQMVRKLGLCVKTRLPACPSRRHKQESDSAP